MRALLLKRAAPLVNRAEPGGRKLLPGRWQLRGTRQPRLPGQLAIFKVYLEVLPLLPLLPLPSLALPLGSSTARLALPRARRQVRDWSEAARVEEPFQRSSLKTLFRRLHWSPDGQFLCCPHAFKKPVNIAVVLRRPLEGTDWQQECDFVGHDSPVACCAFSPATYTRERAGADGGSRLSSAYFCCALGGQDCHLSIWLTSKAKPLIVVRDLFEQDVLDLSWTPDGYHLLACSMDGTLAVVTLSVEELGAALTPQERAALPPEPQP